jgi:hypothetical protein
VILYLQHCTEKPDSWMTVNEVKAGLAIIQALPWPMLLNC